MFVAVLQSFGRGFVRGYIDLKTVREENYPGNNWQNIKRVILNGSSL